VTIVKLIEADGRQTTTIRMAGPDGKATTETMTLGEWSKLIANPEIIEE